MNNPQFHEEDMYRLTAADLPMAQSEKARPLDEVLNELDEFVGTRTVKNMIRRLAVQSMFIKQRAAMGAGKVQQISMNFILAGNPGTGKTHIATGLALKACMEGKTVLFTSVPHLITQIKECKSLKTLHQLELRFKKYDVVVCDEFGYVSCDKEAGELLFNHLSLRADAKSTIITTNLAFDRWGEVIRDKVLVAAMVDRLTHNAYLINMNGESYRLKETRKFNSR
jgi:DNA replication protein DnaC